jgi:hypothetical protein
MVVSIMRESKTVPTSTGGAEFGEDLVFRQGKVNHVSMPYASRQKRQVCFYALYGAGEFITKKLAFVSYGILEFILRYSVIPQKRLCQEANGLN